MVMLARGRRPTLRSSRIPNRPYVYLCGFTHFDTQIYDISNTARPKLLYDWTIEHPGAAQRYRRNGWQVFQDQWKYYYAQSYQFMQGSPDADLGAVIFDVTGLPDTRR